MTPDLERIESRLLYGSTESLLSSITSTTNETDSSHIAQIMPYDFPNGRVMLTRTYQTGSTGFIWSNTPQAVKAGIASKLTQ